MWVLALDTATTDLVTGLVNTETGAVFDAVVTDTRAHNELLVPTVEALLADAAVTFADLGAAVVGCGPGPFTGLRVGMASASAFAGALGIPVHGVCTHDAVAQQATADSDAAAGRLLVATDARRKEIYFAAYEDGVRVGEPQVAAPATVSTDFDAVLIPTALSPRLPEQLQGKVLPWAGPTARGLVAVADLDSTPAPLQPLYLRRPDAVPPTLPPTSPALH